VEKKTYLERLKELPLINTEDIKMDLITARDKALGEDKRLLRRAINRIETLEKFLQYIKLSIDEALKQ
jgi:hypothetical protein